jgi:hypothetical protein
VYETLECDGRLDVSLNSWQ